MRSGELARLAGVTVRALRHYHQVGVLPEPHRGSNDYRDYDVHHLVRVLRITRMASLGIPLEQMLPLLDDDAAADDGGAAATGEQDQTDELLQRLDAELAEQMERMARQRALIADLRAHRSPPDLPPELARVLHALAGWRPSPGLARIDRDQSVLMAHFLGEEGTARLVQFYRRFADPALAAAYADVSQRFEGLGPDSSTEAIEDVAARLAATLAPLVTDESAAALVVDLGRVGEHLSELAEAGLNEQQLQALAVVEARLADQ